MKAAAMVADCQESVRQPQPDQHSANHDKGGQKSDLLPLILSLVRFSGPDFRCPSDLPAGRRLDTEVRSWLRQLKNYFLVRLTTVAMPKRSRAACPVLAEFVEKL